MECSSSRGRSPETDPMWASSLRPLTLMARCRGPRSIAVRVVLGAVLLNKCEGSPVLHSCCTAVCRLFSEEQRARRSCACFVFSKAVLVSGVWNWIFKHSHPLPHCWLSSTLCSSPTGEEIPALGISSGTEVQRCLPSAHALGSTKGLFSIDANSNLLLGQTLSAPIPISRGDGSRRGVTQVHPALGSQAPESPALPVGFTALQARSGVQEIPWWLHHHQRA